MWLRFLGILTFSVFAAAWVLSDRPAAPESTSRAAARTGKTPKRQVQVLAESPRQRHVRHFLGETWIPAAPQRVLGLSGYNAFITDSLLALGVQPVGVEGSWMTRRQPLAYLARRLGDVPSISYGGVLNLETVLATEPDLIIVSADRYGRYLEPLSRIAPTVAIQAVDAGGIDESILLDIGELVGRLPTAERVLADYHRRVDQSRKTLAARAAGKPVAFLRFRRNTCVIYSRTQKVGPILIDRLGLTPDPMMPAVHQQGGWDVLSLERMSMLAAEHLFVVVDFDCEHFFRETAETPMWQSIPAVRAGQVHRVPYDTWLGDGILAYSAILDDVLAAMAAPENP